LERIQDFFKHVGERLRNPFIFSYLISWLISNYKIVIGLFFYTNYQLKADGYNSYFDLIDKTTNWQTCLIIPLIGALAYTFAFPYFKRLVVLLYTRINQGQEVKTLKILEEGSISTVKYLRLRDEYKQSQAKLEEVIQDESKFFSQRRDLNEQVSNLRKENLGLQGDIIKLQQSVAILEKFKEPRDVEFLNGEWKGVARNGNSEIAFEFRFDINKNRVFIKYEGYYVVSIVALIRFDKIVYFEFIGIEKAHDVHFSSQFVNYSNPSIRQPTYNVDVLQNKLPLQDAGGYYIFKLDNDLEMKVYSRLFNPFLLRKVQPK